MNLRRILLTETHPMPKALIVNPKVPVTYWSFWYAVRMEGKRTAFPPLGALTLAGMIPEEWEIRIADENVKRIKNSDLCWADAVLISAMTVQEKGVKAIASRARRFGKPVLIGGPIVSTGQPLDADALVEGEAEDILPDILDDLKRNALQPRYKAQQRPSLDRIPRPRWDLINLKHYSCMTVQFSRGCPFNCDFCDITKIYGRIARVKPVERFIEELQSLYDAGWRGSVFVVDDNFIGNVAAVKQLLPTLERWQRERDYPFVFITEASVNLSSHPEILGEMVRAGWRKVFLGIETPVKQSLQESNKRHNLSGSLLEQVETIQRAGLEVMSGFILGFDSDPADVFDLQYDFISKSGIPNAMVGLLNAIPGTDLYKRLEREGRIISEFMGNNTDGLLNYLPAMDAATLIKGYKNLVKKIYHPREYYRRALIYLERVKESPNFGYKKLKIKDYLAFIRSTYRLGIIGKERFAYWAFLTKAFIWYRHRFGEAVALAIAGYHFRRVTETYLS